MADGYSFWSVFAGSGGETGVLRIIMHQYWRKKTAWRSSTSLFFFTYFCGNKNGCWWQELRHTSKGLNISFKSELFIQKEDFSKKWSVKVSRGRFPDHLFQLCESCDCLWHLNGNRWLFLTQRRKEVMSQNDETAYNILSVTSWRLCLSHRAEFSDPHDKYYRCDDWVITKRSKTSKSISAAPDA